ncbi:MAG: histidinol dehydrogenase [Candidatus Marinimicrobia bacterium]|nr:histidinol dehydrogenase [Candidatus Neomarinimicrobiota bacterium]
MNIINYPQPEDYAEILQRPAKSIDEIKPIIMHIINDVRIKGDSAIRDFNLKFDGVNLKNIAVSDEEFNEAEALISRPLKEAINRAIDNIAKFHASQKVQMEVVETAPGVKCWQKEVPIEKVGLYIPGGTAPLFSTVLMLSVPAKIAGCQEIVLCTPPNNEGRIHPAILYAAQKAGTTQVYKVGGAQAIAAMAYGTETIPQVFKIFGPGNQYVTAAKQLLSNEIAIDMPAGPSEVCVVADNSADSEFIAADLLSQSEHGIDSQAILITDSKDLIVKVNKIVDQQLAVLPRRETATEALKSSKLILVENMDKALELANFYASEHLIINTVNCDDLAEKVVNAGSVFIGKYSPESAGDYASGTNHVLPTYGFARNFSGVSLNSFMKKITYQKLSAEGIRNIGPAIELMAEAEELFAHKNAVTVRLKFLEAGNE